MISTEGKGLSREVMWKNWRLECSQGSVNSFFFCFFFLFLEGGGGVHSGLINSKFVSETVPMFFMSDDEVR